MLARYLVQYLDNLEGPFTQQDQQVSTGNRRSRFPNNTLPNVIMKGGFIVTQILCGLVENYPNATITRDLYLRGQAMRLGGLVLAR